MVVIFGTIFTACVMSMCTDAVVSSLTAEVLSHKTNEIRFNWASLNNHDIGS